MAVLLVTYDLNKETVRPKIVAAIKKGGTWARLSESSYAVYTEETPTAVYQGLRKFLDANDNLLVINMTEPHDGQASAVVKEWLDDLLPP